MLGVGMCLCMGVLGVVGSSALTMVLGVVIGCIGIVGVGVNYPLYKKILTKSKNKYASDIIQLANEIANESV